jgi:hypothetical protein
MPYCITLRSITDAEITGWYAGKNCVWSTDHTRQKRERIGACSLRVGMRASCAMMNSSLLSTRAKSVLA